MGLVSSILGLRQDYNGLYVQPDIPETIKNEEISNMRYQARRFSFKFVRRGKNFERIVIDGKENDNFLYIFDLQKNELKCEQAKK